MKLLNLLIEIKKKELEIEKRKLFLIEKKKSELEAKLKKCKEELEETKKLDVENILILSLRTTFQNQLLEDIENLEKLIISIDRVFEKQKEKIFTINSEIKLLEKKKKAETLKIRKKEDILIERFVNEVLSYPRSV
ncbi:hypothetical protein Dester_1245 [Desulfurobacterium thermolithotrophum DSM 11699]|uniref:Flagellar FliJ protein n=1 Tax=Desulfurobacterium thermolithotrophum (strain DSM 11699 / BSA) TaxID=868864 RepID=F0S0S8_DESTD|nr:hypothetical protein [Desulfurobacterium thermolithotrophum]ADY73881.1 hypothetical protein Dester_1245 [Desulfurobacterium thermolithotrophum DSM 11699]